MEFKIENDKLNKPIVRGTQSCVKVATCNLAQWAMDFEGNLKRTIKSIEEAKKHGCNIRNGPELELAGYSCEDHFLEEDTFYHCWQSLLEILKDEKLTKNIICTIGMPVRYKSVAYNCAVWILNSKIILIRPKTALANDGNYREERYFTAWTKVTEVEQYKLPKYVQEVTNQIYVPFGTPIIQTNDALLANETCEELFIPNSPFILYALNGVDIILNGSGSHHNLRKLHNRVELIAGASKRSGGVYLYANQQGCDGGRLYFDGCAMVFCNGNLLSQGAQFSVYDVENVYATVDLSSIHSFRHKPSFGKQAEHALRLPCVNVDFWVTYHSYKLIPDEPIDVHYLSPEQEIAYGPACWLWDYLRRSGANGFFLPLSGGADSSASACIVGIMCNLIIKAIHEQEDEQVLKDVQKLVNNNHYIPKDAKELASNLFYTCYMGTTNSSKATRERSKNLAKEIGTYHIDCDIDVIITAMITLFCTITNKKPQFKMHGGTNAENLALQNIQARLRMVLSYMLAQLLPWVRGRQGWLLVLGSSNVDEALRGYLTKYDCSSADINPIGAISKQDLKKFLLFIADYEKSNIGYQTLVEIVKSPASAELEPTSEDYTQTSEVDMKMTYEELGIFGRLRKIQQCGPVSMYEKLLKIWSNTYTPTEIAKKVKTFFYYYAVNRHKSTVLTPSYHAENYSPDDNRFDHRPFLYPLWERQFKTIDSLLEEDEKFNKKQKENENNNNNNNEENEKKNEN